MAAPGTQSPSSDKPDPLGTGNAPQLTQAEQRPAAGQDTKQAPGEDTKGGPSSAAISQAQASASALGDEGGQSRKEVETGQGNASQ